ncbi:IS5 family transposase [Stappia sp.]|uniref:IS5 family transposase n=1 Tax=Stappia sp. TaxID=1870903 RepID=UPI003A9A3E39
MQRLLPTDTRRKARVDDRRVISRIIHVLKSDGRWIDASDAYGPRKTLHNRFVRWSKKGIWTGIFDTLSQIGGPVLEGMIDSTAVRAHQVPHGGKGGQAHALGRARGGPGTKIHALSDNKGRPIAFHLTGANVSDFTGAEALLPLVPENGVLHGDKGYDSDRIRRTVEARGALPNIPPHKSRKWKNCFSPYLYKGRLVIEQMFCRLTAFRRIATRYDRSARNFLSALCLAATVCYWL